MFIECQSVDDTTMAIRMIEYDFPIVIENVQKQGCKYRMDFPKSCVLYLRSSRDKMKLDERYECGYNRFRNKKLEILTGFDRLGYR